MNNLRTLLLIPVFFIQITGFMMSSNSESFRSFESSGNRTLEIKRQTSSITETPSKNLQILKKEEAVCDNNPLCRKETTLKSLNQPTIIIKTTENPPVKVVQTEKKHTQHKTSATSLIRFIGSGSEELF